MDGARFSNAAYALNVSFRELTADLGIDVLSFGGTKNGLMMGEAVVFLNPDCARDFKFRRKQAAQLPSKTRFIAAQFCAYFENKLWREIAEHACLMAKKLELALRGCDQVQIRASAESNAVFAAFPRQWIKALREEAFFYVWDEKTFECRLMTSWDTEEADIENFVRKVKELAR